MTITITKADMQAQFDNWPPTVEFVNRYNQAVRDGTVEGDPIGDHTHPFHDVVCGWTGEMNMWHATKAA